MTLSTLLAAGRRLLASAGGPARGAWCLKQRRRLRSGGGVVWIRGDTLPWARWGARHGFFDVELMDGLAYLQVVASPRR